MRIAVSLNTLGMQQAIRDLKKRGMRAEIRAINRSAESAKVAMAREIQKDMKVRRVSDVKERIRVETATETKREATLYASSKRLSVWEMGAKGPYPSRGKGFGVTARTPTRRYPGAFIAKMRSGHWGVFKRDSKARLPIKELRYVSIYHVFQKFRPVAVARALEQLQKNLKHEFRFALKS